jgi:hypothetical protein
VSRFRSGQKHQQQQAEPVHKVQNALLMLCGLHESGCEREPAEDGRAEHNPSQDFADNPGLSQFYKKIAQQLCQPDQKQEHEKNRRQIRV